MSCNKSSGNRPVAETVKRVEIFLEALAKGGNTADMLSELAGDSKGKVASTLRRMRNAKTVRIGGWAGLQAVYMLGKGPDVPRTKSSDFLDLEHDSLPIRRSGAKVIIRPYDDLPAAFFRL